MNFLNDNAAAIGIIFSVFSMVGMAGLIILGWYIKNCTLAAVAPLSKQIADNRTESKADMNELRSDFKIDMSAMRTEIKADMRSMRAELHADHGALGLKFDALNTRLGRVEGKLDK